MLSISELTSEALALPVESRAFLAEKLLETLDSEADFAVGDAWRAEVLKRCEEIDSGVVQTIPAEEVFRELRNTIA